VANHKQALKRHRQSVVRAERNHFFLATLRGALKKARAAVSGGADNAQAAAQHALTLLDRVAVKGIIPKGRADRLKSRLASQAARVG
jgi:small subunit ribosomal protein S20